MQGCCNGTHSSGAGGHNHVKSLTLKYTGTPGNVSLSTNDGSGGTGSTNITKSVQTGETVIFAAAGSQKFGSNSTWTYPGGSIGLHTSCSQNDVVLGVTFGPFEILGIITADGCGEGTTTITPVVPPTDWSYNCLNGDNTIVEVKGKGTNGNASRTLNFSNTSTIQQIVVEAVHKNGTPPASMTFTNNLSQTFTVAKSDIYNTDGSVNASLAAYRATFPASSSITLTTPSPSTTWSFVAYCYRTTSTPSTFSAGKYASTNFYQLGINQRKETKNNPER